LVRSLEQVARLSAHVTWLSAFVELAPSPHGEHDKYPLSPLALPRHLNHCGDDCNIVLEWVIKELTSSIVYPMLTRTNYTEWCS
jgi:hypothetical protein